MKNIISILLMIVGVALLFFYGKQYSPLFSSIFVHFPLLLGIFSFFLGVLFFLTEDLGKVLQFRINFLRLIYTILAFSLAYVAYVKIDYLPKTYLILELGDRCNYRRFDGGKYLSYKQLLDLNEKIEDKDLKRIISEQINDIKNLYLGTEAYVSNSPDQFQVHKTKQDRRKTESLYETEDDMNLQNVVDQLNNATFWSARIRSTYLLKSLNNKRRKKFNAKYNTKVEWEGILGKLINQLNADRSLMVRKTALDAFRQLTGFQAENEENIFDFESAAKCWKEKRPAILKNMKNDKKFKGECVQIFEGN